MIICPECEGMGETRKDVLVPCKDCHGHGKRFFVAQYFELWKPCDSCDGTGKIVTEDEDEEEEVVEECYDCSATGFGSRDVQYSCIAWRQSTDFKEGKGHSEIVLCPRCRGVENMECEICDGIGTVVRFREYCSKCEGSGGFSSFNPVWIENDCDQCEARRGQFEIELRRIREVESDTLDIADTVHNPNLSQEPVTVINIASPARIPLPRFGEIWTAFPGMRFCGIEPGQFIHKDICFAPNGSQQLVRQFEIEIDCGFWLAEMPCTQAQWEAIMGYNPSAHVGKDHPVEQITWTEAGQFCDILTGLHDRAGLLPSGWRFELPSNEEWEYACRAGTTTDLNSGKDLTVKGTEAGYQQSPELVPGCPNLDKVAWYSRNSNGQTHPVGQKLANPWGLYDMHGNVFEWCSDEWSLKCGYVGHTPWSRNDPTRIANGGSFASPAGLPDFDVAGNRVIAMAGGSNVGFRVAIKL